MVAEVAVLTHRPDKAILMRLGQLRGSIFAPASSAKALDATAAASLQSSMASEKTTEIKLQGWHDNNKRAVSSLTRLPRTRPCVDKMRG
jgi:hypothetical protein